MSTLLFTGMPFSTYDDPCNTILGIAVFLQMLRHGDKDAGRQRHVEDSILFFATLFKLFQMFIEVDEGFVLVILARYVGAERTEAI